MYFIAIDGVKNCLSIRLSGQFDAAEAEALGEALEQGIEELSSGFVTVTDLTGLESMDPAAIPYMQKFMDRCNEKEIGKVIRVIPDSLKNFGLTVMGHFHYDHRVSIVTVSCVKEAQKRI